MDESNVKDKLITAEELKFVYDALNIIPSFTSADNGKILRIVDGQMAWVAIPNAEEASF